MVQPETIPVQGPAGRKDWGGDIAALRRRVTELTKLVAQMQGRLEALEAENSGYLRAQQDAAKLVEALEVADGLLHRTYSLVDRYGAEHLCIAIADNYEQNAAALALAKQEPQP